MNQDAIMFKQMYQMFFLCIYFYNSLILLAFFEKYASLPMKSECFNFVHIYKNQPKKLSTIRL